MSVVGVDLDGGDYGCEEVARGIVKAVKDGFDPSRLIAFGVEESARTLGQFGLGIRCVVCSERIAMNHKVMVGDCKKNCSLSKGIKAVQNKDCNIFVSAGNSAAVVSLSVMILKRIQRGINPAIGVVLPSYNGHCLLLDIGANASASASDLLGNAMLGSAYLREVMEIEHPKVGLLNIGEEQGKGHPMINQAHNLLRESSDINFVGNAEGNDIFTGRFDVVVTDGFTGNIILKSGEGLVRMVKQCFLSELKSGHLQKLALPFLLCAAPFLYPTFKSLGVKLDPSEYGGALLLGVRGNVVITHGRSQAKTIAKVIRTAGEIRSDMSEVLLRSLKKAG